MFSIAAHKEHQAATHKVQVAQARNAAKSKGVSDKDADLIAGSVPIPLMSYHDSYTAHFVGDDAKAVASVLKIKLASPVDGQPHACIDLRQWNMALQKLVDAGVSVSRTEAKAGDFDDE